MSQIGLASSGVNGNATFSNINILTAGLIRGIANYMTTSVAIFWIEVRVLIFQMMVQFVFVNVGFSTTFIRTDMRPA